MVSLPARLGKYELLRHIATGGMAELYFARVQGIQGFEKLCAVKKILPHLAGDPSFLKRFIDEARLAARLHHPNIVQVYDIGESSGAYFFSMEFVDGQDLSQILQRLGKAKQRLPLDHALTIVTAACAGIHYAHEATMNGRALGLVHRDVSPQNLLVSYEGAVKVTDFGVAKMVGPQGHGVSKGGMLRGKLGYMSPEQAQGLPVDRRSDIFSLGIVLWETTTFKRLYKAATDYDVLKAICDADAPRPTRVRPDYPPALERIVMKALSRDPDGRYESAEAMQVDLEEFVRQERLGVSAVSLGRFMREIFGVDSARLELGQRRKALIAAAAEAAAAPAPAPAPAPEPTPRPPAPARLRPMWAVLFVAIVAALSGGAWFLTSRLAPSVTSSSGR